jgi:hypothetical protein
MMGYRDNDDCLAKVAPDEPIFVLRAKDKLAPMMVALWIRLAQEHGCPMPKLENAARLKQAMRDWQTQNGSKWPD